MHWMLMLNFSQWRKLSTVYLQCGIWLSATGMQNGCWEPVLWLLSDQTRLLIDCDQPGKRAGESTDSAWKRCAKDIDCASECVREYYNKYGDRCPDDQSECESMARLHNGGPRGCTKSATNRYWNRIMAQGCS